MKREKVLMSQKQLQRYRMMGLVEERRITSREAGEKIGVSHRQAKRIWQRVREKGVKGLIHGNTGRIAWNRISEVVREFVIKLIPLTLSLSPANGGEGGGEGGRIKKEIPIQSSYFKYLIIL
jgi:predicted DNA-binding protein (UPF0251 family)